MVLAGEVLGRWGRGSPAKLRREVRLRSMGDSLAVDGGAGGGEGAWPWPACECAATGLCSRCVSGGSRAGVASGVAGAQGLTVS
jgi:hypothetical protein